MKLSIITVCYNEPDIEKTCESIVKQVHQDFEWIVIDGGSNKETIDILNTYKNRINIFVSEKDNGIYHAMNKGINLASGEYLLFLNAGDLFYNKDVLKKVWKFLRDKDIVVGDLKVLQGEKAFIKKYPRTIPYDWLISDVLPHPSSFIKKKLFTEYGLYNENHKIVSDWEKSIEFIDVNKCSYKHIPVLVSVFNENGISSSLDDLQQKERSEVIAKYYGVNDVQPPTKEYIKFFNIPVIKIIKKFHMTAYYLFGILPILKITNRPSPKKANP